jgi:DNA-binding MarR family transcriptional regulator
MARYKASYISPTTQRAYEIICEQPGISQYDLMTALGKKRQTAEPILATLEQAGLLVAQEGSQLWPFTG